MREWLLTALLAILMLSAIASVFAMLAKMLAYI